MSEIKETEKVMIGGNLYNVEDLSAEVKTLLSDMAHATPEHHKASSLSRILAKGILSTNEEMTALLPPKEAQH